MVTNKLKIINYLVEGALFWVGESGVKMCVESLAVGRTPFGIPAEFGGELEMSRVRIVDGCVSMEESELHSEKRSKRRQSKHGPLKCGPWKTTES